MTFATAPRTGRRFAPRRLTSFPILRRFGQQRLAVASLVFLVLVVVAAALAAVLSPYSPEATDLTSTLAGPGAGHLLGTDDLGRDLLTRMLFGARTTLLAAAQATLLAVVGGIPLGMVAGYIAGSGGLGQFVDSLLSRIADAIMTFPALLLAVIIVGLTGPGLTNAMIAIGVVYAPRLFRVGRAAVLNVVPETYVNASRTVGCSPARILMRHVLPNALSPVLVQVSLTMGTATLAEASLSFLGLGVQAPEASWGSILGRSVPFMATQPAAVVASGLAISLLVLAFNVLGDGLRDSIGRERRS